MKKILMLMAVVFLTASAQAEKVTLSRSSAFQLHAALSKLQAGLSPENTMAAADDINALEGAAKSFRQGYAKLIQLQSVSEISHTPEAAQIFRTADASFSDAADKLQTYDLALFTITPAEVKAAAITPADLATIKRLLVADKFWTIEPGHENDIEIRRLQKESPK